MARYDEYDDDEDQDEDFDRPRRETAPKLSGAVTAVGILGIVLGSMALVCGACVGLGGAAVGGFQGVINKELIKQGKGDPNLAKAAADLARIPFWWIVVLGVLDSLRGGLLLVGGIGTLKRKNWGRLLLLVMAILGVLMVFVGLAGNIALGLSDPQQFVSVFFNLLIQAGFAVFAFIVLLKAANVREFQPERS